MEGVAVAPSSAKFQSPIENKKNNSAVPPAPPRTPAPQQASQTQP